MAALGLPEEALALQLEFISFLESETLKMEIIAGMTVCIILYSF